VTTRTPLWAGRRQASIISDFQKEEFSARGSGNAKAHDSAHEIGFDAHTVARRFQPDARHEFGKLIELNRPSGEAILVVIRLPVLTPFFGLTLASGRA
jgi:hypothetical protein